MIMDSVSTVVSVVTLVLVWIGLNTWWKQLKGENTYKLAIDTLYKLKRTLSAIDDYRNPIYSPNEIYVAFSKYSNGKVLNLMNDEESKLAQIYVEYERWNRIIEQFNTYEDSLLKLKVSTNNYDIDLNLINDKRLGDYIQEMKINVLKRKFINNKRKKYESMNENELNKLESQYSETSLVLSRYDKDEDVFGKNLGQYFEEMNKKLRKYTK